MKRKWAYLGALLPLSTAMSAWAVGAGAYPYDDTNKLLRPKNAPEEDGGKPSNKQGDQGSDEDQSVGVHAPGDGASGGESSETGDGDALNLSQTGGSPMFQVSLPGTDSSMYAPDGGGDATAVKLGGGGGGGSVTLTSTSSSADEGTDSDPTSPEDSGYAEPDPVDEHAMLILLGGMATGEGDGAASSGEVIFDVVDYGPFTIGYGYAIYAANGSEGAEADTFFSVYGADLVFTYGDEGSNGDSAYSTTYVLAIDFEDGLDAEQHPGLSSLNWMELLAQGPFAPWLGGEEDEPVSVNGNLGDISFTADVQDDSAPDVIEFSSLAFDNSGSSVLLWLQSEQAALFMNAEAQGIDTMVSGEGSLLEIQDQFSSVTGAVTIIA